MMTVTLSALTVRLKFDIRQQCVKAILRVMEAGAKKGVLCRLRNIRGREVVRLLYPKLAAMNFDQPEAQMFYGHQNKLSCSHCMRRVGHSAFRRSRRQRGSYVRRLYTIATGNDPNFTHMARKKLKHWGFNWERQCCLHLPLWPNLLVRLRGHDKVFPSLDYRDDLHGLLIFLHRILFEAMDFIPFTAAHKRLLDRRLEILGASKRLKDNYGKTFRNQRTIFGEKHMTGSDRACVIFLLPYVLGFAADSVLPHERIYFPLMTAISRAQLMLIASRGLRLYTQSELRDIFDRGNVELFSALETVRRICHRIRTENHQSRPSQYSLPPTFVPKRKYDSETDTADTDDEWNIDVGPYSHGEKCLVHQHWVGQVMELGGFNVNSAQSAEGVHKLSVKEAATRVRHLRHNTTQKSMLRYLCYRLVFERVKVVFNKDSVVPAAGRVVTPAVGVFKPLLNPDSSPVQMETGSSFTTQVFQTQFIHEEVLVCRYELMDMLCDKFGMPNTLQSYAKLEHLQYMFGVKFVRSDGDNFWSTDTQYPFDTAYRFRKRRDSLLIDGYHETVARDPVDNHLVRKRHALCGEATCFITISNISHLALPCLDRNLPRPRTVKEKLLYSSVVNDSVSFVLLRWFEPHELCTSQDKDYLPICPPPLNINHCLWKYAESTTDRGSIIHRGNPTPALRRQRALFGSTPLQQQTNIQNLRKAYYGLVYVKNIKEVINICPCFRHGTCDVDPTVWLQTVTVI